MLDRYLILFKLKQMTVQIQFTLKFKWARNETWLGRFMSISVNNFHSVWMCIPLRVSIVKNISVELLVEFCLAVDVTSRRGWCDGASGRRATGRYGAMQRRDGVALCKWRREGIVAPLMSAAGPGQRGRGKLNLWARLAFITPHPITPRRLWMQRKISPLNGRAAGIRNCDSN